MKQYGKGITKSVTVFLMLFFTLCMFFTASASAQTRIVVIPHYVEDGADMKWSRAVEHFETVIGPINNQLAKHGFENQYISPRPGIGDQSATFHHPDSCQYLLRVQSFLGAFLPLCGNTPSGVKSSYPETSQAEQLGGYRVDHRSASR